MVKLIQNIIKINNIFEKAILLLCLLSSIIADVEWYDTFKESFQGYTNILKIQKHKPLH